MIDALFILLHLAGWVLLFALLTFIGLPFYVCAKKALQEERIPPKIVWLVKLIVGAFGICDVLLNFLITPFLWDAWIQKAGGHREITFSQRLARLLYDAAWRGAFARFVAVYFILWVDPDHFDWKPE